MKHPLRIFIVNLQFVYPAPDGWRGDVWHDFADTIAAHFEAATLFAPFRLDGGAHFDVWPLSHLRVEPAEVPDSFLGFFKALLSRSGRRALRKIRDLVRTHDIVLLRAPDPSFPLVAAYCRWYSKPLVVAMTGDIVKSNQYVTDSRPIRRLVGLLVGRLLRLIECLSMLIRTDLVFVYGEEARRTYQSFAKNVYVTIEGSLLKSMIVKRDDACARGKIRILQVANYHRNKNFPMLLLAASRLLEKGYDVEVHLAGSPSAPEVAAKIAEMRRQPLLAGRVVEHGFLRKAELYKLYQECDLITLTSFSEGWPRVLMEGASFGLPIVSTAVGGIQTVIQDGHNGLLVESDDDHALSDAIERVINDQTLRRQLVKHGYELAAWGAREAVTEHWVAEMVRRGLVRPRRASLRTEWMSSSTLKLYWKLPYAVKCLAASWIARQWDQERFGQEYDQLVNEIQQRNGWTPKQFSEYQCQQLQSVVRDAAAHVPYYRRLFAQAGIDPATIREPADLKRVPITHKSTLRARNLEFVDDRYDVSKLIPSFTSGTTGTPLTILADVWAQSARFAYTEVRCHDIGHVRRRRDSSVSLGIHMVAEPGRKRPPFWVVNRRWKQLYMSSYHLSQDTLPDCIQALRDFGGTYIEGYPSCIDALARFIVERNLDPIPFKACFTTAETLMPHHRERFERAFGCKTYDQYGCAEMVIFAADCAHGRLHLSPEMGIVEILDDEGNPVEPGMPGALVCTGLVNRAQPLIRYKLGDRVALSPESCTCGSTLPVLGTVEGRIEDMVLLADGRRICRFDPVFKGLKGVAAAQIVQDALDQFRIRIVATDGYTSETGDKARIDLEERLGANVTVALELVPEIERTAAGKFKAVVSNLNPPSVIQ